MAADGSGPSNDCDATGDRVVRSVGNGVIVCASAVTHDRLLGCDKQVTGDGFAGEQCAVKVESGATCNSTGTDDGGACRIRVVAFDDGMLFDEALCNCEVAPSINLMRNSCTEVR